MPLLWVQASADTAADDYVRNVLGLDRFRLEKDGGEWPIGFCPDCDWLACVHAKLDGYLCFGCGAQWQVGDLAKCGRCGRLIDSEKNDIPVCLKPDARDYFLNSATALS